MLYTMFFLLSTSFYRYKQGYKVIVVLNLGKMPGKQYTNKEIIEKLEKIEKDIETTSKIIDKKLIDIKSNLIDSKGLTISYAILATSALAITLFLALDRMEFFILFILFVILAIITQLYFRRQAKKYRDNN